MLVLYCFRNTKQSVLLQGGNQAGICVPPGQSLMDCRVFTSCSCAGLSGWSDPSWLDRWSMADQAELNNWRCNVTHDGLLFNGSDYMRHLLNWFERGDRVKPKSKMLKMKKFKSRLDDINAVKLSFTTSIHVQYSDVLLASIKTNFKTTKNLDN